MKIYLVLILAISFNVNAQENEHDMELVKDGEALYKKLKKEGAEITWKFSRKKGVPERIQINRGNIVCMHAVPEKKYDCLKFYYKGTKRPVVTRSERFCNDFLKNDKQSEKNLTQLINKSLPIEINPRPTLTGAGDTVKSFKKMGFYQAYPRDKSMVEDIGKIGLGSLLVFEKKSTNCKDKFVAGQPVFAVKCEPFTLHFGNKKKAVDKDYIRDNKECLTEIVGNGDWTNPMDETVTPDPKQLVQKEKPINNSVDN